MFSFSQGMVRADEITLRNLSFLKTHLPQETTLYVDGDKKDAKAISIASGGKFGIHVASELKSFGDAAIIMDFTSHAAQFLNSAKPEIPAIIQSNQKEQMKSILAVPPLFDNAGSIWAGSSKQGKLQVFRAGDCVLSGISLVLHRLFEFFSESIYISFLADRNVGKGPGSQAKNTFYFSDKFPRIRSGEITRLSGRNAIVNATMGANGPFYLATFHFPLNPASIEKHFGSWTKFDSNGRLSSFASDGARIIQSSDDNTKKHYLPPEPPFISGFASQYSQDRLFPPIVFFGRTQHRSGQNFTFTMGFDVNITSVLSNIDLLALLSGKAESENPNQAAARAIETVDLALLQPSASPHP